MAIRKLDLNNNDSGSNAQATINIEVIRDDTTPKLSHSEFEK